MRGSACRVSRWSRATDAARRDRRGRLADRRAGRAARDRGPRAACRRRRGATRALARAQAARRQPGSGIARIQLALGAARVADAAKRSDEVLAQLDVTRDTVLLTRASAASPRRCGRAPCSAWATTAPPRPRAPRRRRGRAPEPAGRFAGAAHVVRGGPRANLRRPRHRAARAEPQCDNAFRVADAARGRALIDQLERRTSRAAARRRRRRSRRRRQPASAHQHPGRTAAHRGHDASGAPRPRSAAAARPDAGRYRTRCTLRERRTTASRSNDRPGRVARRIVGASRVDVAAIKRSLAPDERLVEYFAADDRLLIFVLSRSRRSFVEVPVASVADRRASALGARPYRRAARRTVAPLSALYASLVRPLDTARAARRAPEAWSSFRTAP